MPLHSHKRRPAGVRKLRNWCPDSIGTRVRKLPESASTLDDVEIHLVMSMGADATISFETSYEPESVAELAHVIYDERNLAAAIASGTFLTSAMVIAPCSIRTHFGNSQFGERQFAGSRS